MICEIDDWVQGGVQLLVQMLLGCAVWGAVCGAGDGEGPGAFGHAVWGAGAGAVLGVRVTVRAHFTRLTAGCRKVLFGGAVWCSLGCCFGGVAFLQD